MAGTVVGGSSEIAVLGYACRLPQADDPAEFWRLLIEGRCAITQMDEDRWSVSRFLDAGMRRAARTPGRSYSMAAGRLDRIWDFDAGFFGISPREAAQMDPQQRILLEVAWEAVEAAALDSDTLRSARVGVFVGASAIDHAQRFASDPAAIEAQFLTGNTLSILSNRISFALDLRGPSFTLDTACSSSLYALHHAARAIALGEVDFAIVGGVNALLQPFNFVGFSQASMLSASGLCRAFDAAADGYVRAEGAVAFVLAREAEARVAGLPVRSTLVGTGINFDGRTASLSLPSAERQAELLREVHGRVALGADRVAFLEAHGTGTPVGDPIEARAIGEALGRERAAPLPIGSAKSNIGHLEPASGLVGLLKAQLALEHGVYPRTLHVAEVNPAIPAADLGLTVATEPVALPTRPDREPWLAGVSSFGFGGANAHAVLRALRPEPGPEQPEADLRPLLLSAESAESLRRLAGRWRDRLSTATQADLASLISTAAHRRSRHRHRAVVRGKTRADLLEALGGMGGHPGTVTGEAIATGGTAFVFAGNGAQWPGMGRTLYGRDMAFRAAFNRIGSAFRDVAGADAPAGELSALLHHPALETMLDRAEVAQPLLFAVQAALADALGARGLLPDAVAGHSVGEVAAAHVAGALTLEDAVRLIDVRTAAVAQLRGRGGMAAVLAPADMVAEMIAALDLGATLAIAGENSPRSITVAGESGALEVFVRAARSRRLALRRLSVPYPYHGPMMEEIRDALFAGLTGLAPRPARIPIVSSTTGAPVAGETLDAAHWWRNARERVRFDAAIRSLSDLGADVFVEIGPRPVLQTYAEDTIRALGRKASVLATMEGPRRDDDADGFVARAFVAGARLEDNAFFGPALPAHYDLPAYPWDRATHRAETTGERIDLLGAGPEHPLLGARLREGEGSWRVHLDATLLPWLAEHKVDGAAVMPAAGFAEIALAAGREELGTEMLEISDLDILRPLALETGRVTLRTEIERETGIVRIESRPASSADTWVLHARGTVRAAASAPIADPAPDPRVALAAEWSGERLYARLADSGLTYGSHFRRVRRLSAGGSRAEVELDLAMPDGDRGGFLLDPTLLDAALHGLFPLLAAAPGTSAHLPAPTFLPVRIARLTLDTKAGRPERALLRLSRKSELAAEADILLLAAGGCPVARLTGLRLRSLGAGRARRRVTAWEERLLRVAPPGARAARPSAWDDPAARLLELGLATRKSAEPSAGSLLVDAGARRIAWEALISLAGPDGVLPAASSIAPSARPSYLRALAALREDGVLTETEAGLALAPDAPYEPLDTLVDALIAEAPERASDLIRLMRLTTRLRERLAGADAVSTWPQRLPSPDILSAAPAFRAAVADLLAAWPRGARADILVLGVMPPGLAEDLARRFGNGGTTVSDPGATRFDPHPSAGTDVLRRVAWAALSGPFDAVIATDALYRLDAENGRRLLSMMASGAPLIALERGVRLIDDLLEEHVNPATAAALLAEAGLRGESVQRVSGAEGAAFLTGIRSDSRAITEPTPREPAAPEDALALLHDGSAASRDWAQALAEALAKEGQTTRVRPLDVDPPLPENRVVLCPVTGFDAGTASAETWIETCRRLLAVPKAPAAIWIVSRGDGRSGNGNSSPARAAEATFRGLGRVLANEAPCTTIRQIDLDAGLMNDYAARRVAAVLVSAGPERELRLDGAGLAAPRIVPLPEPMVEAEDRAAGCEAGRILALGRDGAVDTLRWNPAPRRAPLPGEVEIEVAATGLNFRDLMWAQRLLPPEALEDGFAGATLGMECAGTIVRAGAGSPLARGTRVIGFAPQAFASHVTVPVEVVAPLPDGMSFEAGAAIPAIFLTAHYALVELARVTEGETVLVHGAAGGVGIAAIQVARARGARVLATAGRSEKRALVRQLGADATFDSRSLAFAEEVHAWTGGAGVDVVLNSLAGEAMARSIDCLAPFGRFVELGKQDHLSNTRVALGAFGRNLSYFGVDADRLIGARPALARRMFAEVMTDVASGALLPPPLQVFEASEAADAFRLMQRAQHVGKIVVRPARPPAQPPSPGPALGEGAWLIVGGLGGFGLATARWLAQKGVRRLWLTGRSGQTRPEAAEYLVDIQALGARVETVAADVADSAAMESLFERIKVDGPPLEGVLHAAMVLDDAPFVELTPERVAAVMRPKVEGAQILDRLTRPLAPRHFVLYSSVAAAFGNPGQASYAAANAALQAIAAGRRAEGLPGLAIAWGPILDHGYLARQGTARTRLERRLGDGMLTAAEALDGLGAIIANPDAGPTIIYAPLDWERLADLPILSTPLFERVRRERNESDLPTADLADELLHLDDEAARARILAALAAECRRILRQGEGTIDPHRPLAEMGFDSLMAVELKMSIEERLGVSLPMMMLGDRLTLSELAGTLLGRLRAEGGGEDDTALIAQVAAQHAVGDISEAAMERVMRGTRRAGAVS